MGRVRAGLVVCIFVILAVASLPVLRRDSVVARSIPVQLKSMIQAEYPANTHLTWQAFCSGTDATFVVIKRIPGRDSPYTVYDIHRVTDDDNGPKVASWPVFWTGGKLEADCSYYFLDSVHPGDPKPYEQYAVGVALDPKTAKVLAVTADARSTEATLFGGFWWMKSAVDPDSYSEDRWVKVVAVDAEGRLICEFVPRYSEIGHK